MRGLYIGQETRCLIWSYYLLDVQEYSLLRILVVQTALSERINFHLIIREGFKLRYMICMQFTCYQILYGIRRLLKVNDSHRSLPSCMQLSWWTDSVCY